jgi:hypothetical protein
VSFKKEMSKEVFYVVTSFCSSFSVLPKKNRQEKGEHDLEDILE